jgi:NAD(P)H-dependent FMN reductase
MSPGQHAIMRFTLILGSVRSERNGLRAARFIAHQLEGRGHEVSLVDAGALDLPLLDRAYGDYPNGTAPAVLERLAETYRAADAFVIVCGEYNHGLPPALKNLLDHFRQEYFFRPSAIVSYSSGPFGGVRAAVHLRAVLGELGMSSVPRMLPIPRVASALDEDGREAAPGALKSLKRFLDELEWYAEALRAHRERTGVPGP